MDLSYHIVPSSKSNHNSETSLTFDFNIISWKASITKYKDEAVVNIGSEIMLMPVNICRFALALLFSFPSVPNLSSFSFYLKAKDCLCLCHIQTSVRSWSSINAAIGLMLGIWTKTSMHLSIETKLMEGVVIMVKVSFL